MHLFTAFHALLMTAALALITGCYPMPCENDYSVIPMTNHPDFKHEGTSPLTPGTDY